MHSLKSKSLIALHKIIPELKKNGFQSKISAYDPHQQIQSSSANSYLSYVQFGLSNCSGEDTSAKNVPICDVLYKSVVALWRVTAAWQGPVCQLSYRNSYTYLLSLSQLQSEASCLKFKLRKFQLMCFTTSLEARSAHRPIFPLSLGAFIIPHANGSF